MALNFAYNLFSLRLHVTTRTMSDNKTKVQHKNLTFSVHADFQCQISLRHLLKTVLTAFKQGNIAKADILPVLCNVHTFSANLNYRQRLNQMSIDMMGHH